MHESLLHHFPILLFFIVVAQSDNKKLALYTAFEHREKCVIPIFVFEYMPFWGTESGGK